MSKYIEGGALYVIGAEKNEKKRREKEYSTL
jgi:hypothetical protein